MTPGKPTKRRARAPAPRESAIQAAILEAFRRKTNYLVWRQNTGAVRVRGTTTAKGRFIRFGVPGQSDLLGIGPGGRFLAIEVKRPGEKLNPNQESYRDMVRSRGGVYIVAHSWEEAIREAELAFPRSETVDRAELALRAFAIEDRAIPSTSSEHLETLLVGRLDKLGAGVAGDLARRAYSATSPGLPIDERIRMAQRILRSQRPD